MPKIPTDHYGSPPPGTLAEQWDLLYKHRQELTINVLVGSSYSRNFRIKPVGNTGKQFDIYYQDSMQRFTAGSMTDLQGCCHILYNRVIQFMRTNWPDNKAEWR